jgi:hypothetical protein
MEETPPKDISKAILSNRKHMETLARISIFIEGAD